MGLLTGQQWCSRSTSAGRDGGRDGVGGGGRRLKLDGIGYTDPWLFGLLSIGCLEGLGFPQNESLQFGVSEAAGAYVCGRRFLPFRRSAVSDYPGS
jgi:hypothetical protein